MVSCTKYETQYEGPYSDKDLAENNNSELSKELVFVSDGVVFLANKFVSDLLVVSDEGGVQVASINNNHTKVLYKRAGYNIQIYDIASGSNGEEVAGSSNAYWFDYHANNETIYFLDGSNLHTVGPEVLLQNPVNLINESGIPNGYLRGATILENGHIVFSVLSLGTFTNRYLFLSDGEDILNTKETQGFMDRIRLSKEEDVLWCGDEYNNFLRQYSLSDLSSETLSSGVFGAPTGSNNGYIVTDDNEIQTPGFGTVEITTGVVTAIDY